MGEHNSITKERKSKWNTSYFNMTTAQAEKILGFEITTLEEVPVGQSNKEVMETKGHVYEL
ncbi:hypothetical protein EV426DRAFT_712060 [Tirmania nivea]|nr:hypothetical protein EV426DRAFT_712060 [Tirmania nivea]